jgi:ABC-type nitrate/sulfonate/bicarbonate transport system substrate-binding protein
LSLKDEACEVEMLKVYSMIVLTISFATATVPAQERLLVSYAGFGGFQAPAWAAKDLGLFTKYGLSTELVMIPGSARGTQALLGGSTQFGQIDGTALIAAIDQGGSRTGGGRNKFIRRGRSSPADSSAKVSIIARAAHAKFPAGTKEWNIPRQSVTLLTSGPAANRLVALSSGALDATLLAPPETGEASRMGLPTLAHMTDLEAAAFPMNVVATRRSFLERIVTSSAQPIARHVSVHDQQGEGPGDL